MAAPDTIQVTRDELRSQLIAATAEALEEVARKLRTKAAEERTGGERVHCEPTRQPVGKQRVSGTSRSRITDRAIEVIGDKAEALRWLGTPLRVLDYETPISRLTDRRGEADVLAVLDKLEHGVL